MRADSIIRMPERNLKKIALFSVFEKRKSGWSQLAQLSRIVHRKTKIKLEGNIYSACNTGFRSLNIYQL